MRSIQEQYEAASRFRAELRRGDSTNYAYYEKAWHDLVARLSKEQRLCPDCNGSGGNLGAPCYECRGYGAVDLAGNPSRVTEVES